MNKGEERRRRKVEQLGEELMRIQMRGCYRQLTAEDEAEYNAMALNGVLRSLAEYLASRKMYIPEATKYGSFAAHGGIASVSSGGSSASIVSTSVSDVKSGADGGEESKGGAGADGSDAAISISGSLPDIGELPELPTSPSSLPDKADIIDYNSVKKNRSVSEKKYSRISAKTAKNLNYKQIDALTNYSQSGYTNINDYLRGLKKEFSSEFERQDVERNINEIASAIEGSRLPKDSNLFRGVYNPTFIIGEGWSEKSLSELRSQYIGTVK